MPNAHRVPRINKKFYTPGRLKPDLCQQSYASPDEESLDIGYEYREIQLIAHLGHVTIYIIR